MADPRLPLDAALPSVPRGTHGRVHPVPVKLSLAMGFSAVTALPLMPGLTRAGIVSPAPSIGRGVAAHDLGRGAARPQQRRHLPHRLADMSEERLVARAQVVLAGFAVGRCCEPVLGA